MEDSAFGCPIFYSTFIIVWWVFYYYFILKEDMSNFFGWKDILNWRAVDLFFVGRYVFNFITLLLVIVVWSIRNKVF